MIISRKSSPIRHFFLQIRSEVIDHHLPDMRKCPIKAGIIGVIGIRILSNVPEMYQLRGSK
jgi:hypothetical protein